MPLFPTSNCSQGPSNSPGVRILDGRRFIPSVRKLTVWLHQAKRRAAPASKLPGKQVLVYSNLTETNFETPTSSIVTP